MTSLPRSLQDEWKALQVAAPPANSPPSGEEELQQRKFYKARVKLFRQKLSPKQWAELTKKEKRKAPKTIRAPSKQLPPLLSPMEESVTLGWTCHRHKFSQLIPFYSHTQRSTTEQYEDEELFQGIDRRCFSNLFVDEKKMRVLPLVVTTPDGKRMNLMRFEFLQSSEGICSESFFQAAKCLHEFDARFIMTELNSMEAAKYGQSRLALTLERRDYLIAAGADPKDFLEVDPKKGQKRWLRGKDGSMPRRSDWEDVKHSIMLHILRSKFCGTQVGPTISKTVEAILSLSSIPLFVEHTRNGQTWGDHGDGSGFNILGKTLAQIFLEIAGEVPSAPITVGTIGKLKIPNKKIVNYTNHSSDDELRDSGESDEEVPEVDCLLVLDFEATCDRGSTPIPQEIIEFPTLLVDARSGRVASKFHCYIKPDVHPQLSVFCTELTGITQKQVNKGISLSEALFQHQQWLDENGLVPLFSADGSLQTAESPQRTFLYVTCGDWDLRKCLPNQLCYHGSNRIPSSFKHWINIKIAFRDLFGKKVGGMTDMLKELGLKLEGRHHSGIDDCRNIARICREMLEEGWRPQCTSYAEGRKRS